MINSARIVLKSFGYAAALALRFGLGALALGSLLVIVHDLFSLGPSEPRISLPDSAGYKVRRPLESGERHRTGGWLYS
jgi:hypothetical protein